MTKTAGSASGAVVDAARLADEADGVSRDLAAAVGAGIEGKAKTFNTHSQALAGRLIAEERALVEIVADIDEKIARLNDERTDAMLAHSGISNALSAMQRGAKL